LKEDLPKGGFSRRERFAKDAFSKRWSIFKGYGSSKVLNIIKAERVKSIRIQRKNLDVQTGRFSNKKHTLSRFEDIEKMKFMNKMHWRNVMGTR
jgi:hypothetical protein